MARTPVDLGSLQWFTVPNKLDEGIGMKTLIVPAAGLGSRFPGYLYKPLIEVRRPEGGSAPMVSLAMAEFQDWYRRALLVVPEEFSAWVSEGMRRDKRIEVVSIKHTQEGQALSVLCCLGQVSDDSEVIVVNSDQFYTCDLNPWFQHLRDRAPDGSLLTFEVLEPDVRWSYARVAPHDKQLVVQVVEKEPVSTHATAGAYYFRRWRTLRTAICGAVAEGERCGGEFYLAPVYNQLIRGGLTVTRHDVSGFVVNVGTPDLLRDWDLMEGVR